MPDKGYFLISDITGYTSFLTQSELDHAQHILEALFECQLNVIEPPLKVSNFQGDAILCYACDESREIGIKVFSQIGKLYKAFTDKIEEMTEAPPCQCRICSTIGLLDLKIFLHYGDYLIKNIGDRQELFGTDVILAHRMMKNKVKEKSGIESYLLITKAALDKIDLSELEFSFTGYSEDYEHIGKVEMQVASLTDFK